MKRRMSLFVSRQVIGLAPNGGLRLLLYPKMSIAKDRFTRKRGQYARIDAGGKIGRLFLRRLFSQQSS
jgi:hypothetical protein